LGVLRGCCWAEAAGLGQGARRGEASLGWARSGSMPEMGRETRERKKYLFFFFCKTEILNYFANQFPNYFQSIFQNKFEPIL
jgi:hypothetical protein